MPAVKTFVETYVGKQVEGGIDPMEAVAKGAAIQAGILGGDVQTIHSGPRDTPHAYGPGTPGLRRQPGDHLNPVRDFLRR